MNANERNLCAPLEEILVSGGDTRSAVDRLTGLNSFGCAPLPQPEALNFGSSTASAISKRALRRVEAERCGLLDASLDSEGLEEQTERLRNELRTLLGLGQTAVEVVFSPSGTDAMLQALFLARALSGDGPLDTIVPASDETGSGAPYALSGRHFSTLTAEGVAVAQGEPIVGLAEGVALISLPLRDTNGVLRPPDAIDQAVIETVSRSVAAGRRVLLQVMDSSKCGRRCPSLDCIRSLQSLFPGAVQIVVDACQMRISLARLQWHLAQGHIVLISGSKFFTGPPFSGALLVPAALSARIEKIRQVACGLKDYTGRSAWPRAWRHIRASLPDRTNFGQYFRWTAAIEEMRIYMGIPADFRYSVLRRLAEMATERICSRHPDFMLMEEWKSPDEIEDAEMGVRTIFPFLLRRGGDTFMSLADSKQLYSALHRNVAETLPVCLSRPEKAIASRLCHLGQPVSILMGAGGQVGALRICFSARTVTDIWSRSYAAPPAAHSTPRMMDDVSPEPFYSCMDGKACSGLETHLAADLRPESEALSTILDKIEIVNRVL